MPKKKEPPLSAEEQRKRFEELARKSGASTSSKDLRGLLERVARPRGRSDQRSLKRK
jgi:hypothetical protein